MRRLDETHDPAARSWVESANSSPDFPIQNLPFGVFRSGGAGAPRIGVAIGDRILDLMRCDDCGLFVGLSDGLRDAVSASSLNALMMLGPDAMAQLRGCLFHILDARGGRADAALLVAMHDAELIVPMVIGDYSDFYASIDHALNVGALFRPDRQLPPSYRHQPIGYHGRSSSILPSGTPIVRPSGQYVPEDANRPIVAATEQLDYELELGALVGRGNALGHPVALDDAEARLFGVCLLNDWSARDIQRWESQPLGPFLGKSFATSISPWIVTLEALAPFRCAPKRRASDDPALLPYLRSEMHDANGGFDIACEAFLSSAEMRDRELPPDRLGRSQFRDLYWTFAQMVTHHTRNGCNLRPGDLIGSGTISGQTDDALGCLLERTRSQPVRLATGETRRFLADGDEVVLRARCHRAGFVSIGLGECRGRIVAAAATETRS